jgi:putative ATP-dependent endonuclease of OLD family
VLSTEGLNFDCFVPLFGDAALPVRVAILSDADPPDTYPKLTDSLVLSSAANAIDGLRNPFVTPFFAQKTLEYDLALHHENRTLMLTALSKIHPTIAASLKTAVEAAPADDKPKVLFCGMFDRASGANVKKGEYSQALAQTILEDGVAFTVPPYIQKALEYVTAA